MEESQGIRGLTSPIGSRASTTSPGYFSMPQRSQHKHLSLRTGEIAHGTILDAPVGKDAVVRLPHGDFTASLSGKLKKGDSLFLKILETEPRLVLKIFAAATKNNGVDLSPADLLRILDLPETEFNKDLIRFLKTRRTIINREEFLSLYRTSMSLPTAQIQSSPKDSFFKAVFYINDAGIQFTPELFDKIKYAFKGPENYFGFFKSLDILLPVLSREIRDRLNILNKSVIRLNDNIHEMLSLLAGAHIMAKKDNDLYNLLQIIVLDENFKTKELSNFQNQAFHLLRSIESQYELNAYAAQWNSPMYLFLPVIIRANKKLSRIILKRTNMPRQGNNFLKFSFELVTEEFGEIVANVSYLNNQISIGLYAGSDKATDFLDKFMPELENSLKSQKLTIKSLTVNKTTEEILDAVNDFTAASGQKFSVVI